MIKAQIASRRPDADEKLISLDIEFDGLLPAYFQIVAECDAFDLSGEAIEKHPDPDYVSCGEARDHLWKVTCKIMAQPLPRTLAGAAVIARAIAITDEEAWLVRADAPPGELGRRLKRDGAMRRFRKIIDVVIQLAGTKNPNAARIAARREMKAARLTPATGP